MFPKNHARRRLHGLHVEWPPANGNIARHKRRANSAAKDPILIDLADSAMPGMEALRGMLCRQNSYRCRKNAIQRALKILRRDGRAQ